MDKVLQGVPLALKSALQFGTEEGKAVWKTATLRPETNGREPLAALTVAAQQGQQQFPYGNRCEDLGQTCWC